MPGVLSTRVACWGLPRLLPWRSVVRSPVRSCPTCLGGRVEAEGLLLASKRSLRGGAGNGKHQVGTFGLKELCCNMY